MNLRHALISLIVLTVTGIIGSVVMAGDDINEFRSCSSCGMDRKAYGYSRMLVTYKDGARTGVCSLHCAVTDLAAGRGGGAAAMMVADRDSRKLLDVEQAFWVIGGRKRGVMTQRAKWAFATREAAQSFVAANGGQIVSWEAALLAAREDMAPPGAGSNK